MDRERRAGAVMNEKQLREHMNKIRSHISAISDVINEMYSDFQNSTVTEEEKSCRNCTGDGGQCWYPSQCTGCGVDGEYKNWKRK